MSFLDIVNQEAGKLKSSGNTDKVEYPKTKHDRIFAGKDNQIAVQILPSADLNGQFWKKIRKLYLTTVSSQGKEVKANFTLDGDENPGSMLEQKYMEWVERDILPKGRYGIPTPNEFYLVNAVRLVQDAAGNWTQERDTTGQLVVRVLELKPSAMQDILNKIQNTMYNISNTQLAFLHPDKSCVTQIEKPADNESPKKYKFHVFPHLLLPPLGQGWEQQLEDLEEQGTPTERLVNGDKWVQAFIDMMEGRKPNQNQGQNAAPAPTVNPYAAQQPNANPFAGQQPPATNPFAGQPAPADNPLAGQVPQQNTYGQPAPAPAAPQQPNITMPTGMGEPTPPPAQPQVNANPATPPVQPQAAPAQPAQPTGGLVSDPLPADFGTPAQTSAAPANEVPLHSVETNSNGLLDVNALLQQEVGDLPTE
ncbi:hypothetical protein [Bacillus phage SBSphiJ1]|nr:hypothetical protein [Bacillus phage SBSphiJ1]